MSDRFHLLKIADKWGWPAVEEFTEVELARNEQDAKKIKKIMKANKARIGKAREVESKGGKQRRRASSNDYRREEHGTEKKKDDRLCFSWNKPGHLSKDCRSQGAKSRGGREEREGGGRRR